MSTLEAAATGNLSGIEGFTSAEDAESIQRIEKQLKKRYGRGRGYCRGTVGTIEN